MTSAYFRALILVSVVASLAGSFADLLFPSLTSTALSAAVENEPLPTLVTEYPWVALVIFLPLVVAGIASTIGLFFFRRWARTLSLSVLGAGFVVAPFIGPTLSSGLSYAFIEFAATTWGAVLAIAYFSPLSQRFSSVGSAHMP